MGRRIGDDPRPVAPLAAGRDLAEDESFGTETGLRTAVIVEAERLLQQFLAHHPGQDAIAAEMLAHLLGRPPQLGLGQPELADHAALLFCPQVDRFRYPRQILLGQFLIVRGIVRVGQVGGVEIRGDLPGEAHAAVERRASSEDRQQSLWSQLRGQTPDRLDFFRLELRDRGYVGGERLLPLRLHHPHLDITFRSVQPRSANRPLHKTSGPVGPGAPHSANARPTSEALPDLHSACSTPGTDIRQPRRQAGATLLPLCCPSRISHL